MCENPSVCTCRRKRLVKYKSSWCCPVVIPWENRLAGKSENSVFACPVWILTVSLSGGEFAGHTYAVDIIIVLWGGTISNPRHATDTRPARLQRSFSWGGATICTVPMLLCETHQEIAFNPHSGVINIHGYKLHQIATYCVCLSIYHSWTLTSSYTACVLLCSNINTHFFIFFTQNLTDQNNFNLFLLNIVYM